MNAKAKHGHGIRKSFYTEKRKKAGTSCPRFFADKIIPR